LESVPNKKKDINPNVNNGLLSKKYEFKSKRKIKYKSLSGFSDLREKIITGPHDSASKGYRLVKEYWVVTTNHE
jgi:hypothetical protein